MLVTTRPMPPWNGIAPVSSWNFSTASTGFVVSADAIEGSAAASDHATANANLWMLRDARNEIGMPASPRPRRAQRAEITLISRAWTPQKCLAARQCTPSRRRWRRLLRAVESIREDQIVAVQHVDLSDVDRAVHIGKRRADYEVVQSIAILVSRRGTRRSGRVGSRGPLHVKAGCAVQRREIDRRREWHATAVHDEPTTRIGDADAGAWRTDAYIIEQIAVEIENAADVRAGSVAEIRRYEREAVAAVE